MNGLLTPLKTIKTADVQVTDDPVVPLVSVQNIHANRDHTLKSPEDALDALKSKPDLDLLTRVLLWLDPARESNNYFTVKIPSPRAAPIVFVLVEEIIPNYWRVLKEDQNKPRKLLIRCLSSVAGLGAISARLRALLNLKEDARDRNESRESSKNLLVEDTLDVLQNMLKKDAFVYRMWKEISSLVPDIPQRSLVWKEFVSFVAAGRILSLASEADHVLNESSSSIKDQSWLGDGNRYATWLGRNIAYMTAALEDDDAEAQKALVRLVGQALTLGYTDKTVETASYTLINGDTRFLNRYHILMHSLDLREKRIYLYSLLRVLSRRHLSSTSNDVTDKEAFGNKSLNGLAALVAGFTQGNSQLEDALVDWLAGTSAGSVSQSHEMHRVVLAAISSDSEKIIKVLQKTLLLFGDKLYIKHTPILHQEINAQILLMVVGYAHRADASYLSNLARSSVYINAISNRLAASSQRASFLGMIVGTAISELVDPKDNRMAFSSEDINSTDGQWYRSLIAVNDAIGSIEDLQPTVLALKSSLHPTKTAISNPKIAKQPTKLSSTSKIVSIEEIVDSSDSEEKDLPTYEKPDSDEDDEDEDPTLVQRDKPIAPVYIRDLIAGLHDTENFDRHKLALSTASALIRRKSNFGTEVSENIEELATLLVGLTDKYEMKEFQKMRLQGMIAVLVAQPLKMGQWFSRTFFNGDYSIGQRVSILTTLGLGARGLAGLQKEDAALTGADEVPKDSFVSKKLPDKLQKLWGLEAAPANALSKQLEKTMIQPMAVEAADKFSGPNALKIRTFSSRMAVEKKRQKPIPNALAKIVADGFFFPLTGLWRAHLQAYGDTKPHTAAPLLPLYLKTLSLLLHASGASTLSLPQMTSEFWSLLLSLRPRATDVSVLEALLFSFLTLLNVNENNKRGLAEEHSKELLETQEWVEAVFERSGGGSEEGERVRMLAAGVLVRCREVVEAWQRLMVGDMADFM